MQREPAVTIFERSAEGRRAATLPKAGVPEPPLDELIPKHLLRERPAELPEVAEPEIVRHYNRMSRRCPATRGCTPRRTPAALRERSS